MVVLMEEFLEKCDEARKYAFSFKDPLIVHHYDADGVSSGSLVAGAFIKENKKFRRECIRKLDDDAIERYLKEQEVIFVDLGGGNKRVNELKDVLIIDHHQSEGIEKFQANPLLHGLDGGSELSASGCAYCVFRVHADLAVVGALSQSVCP
jgi:RecJ-like exonuclease